MEFASRFARRAFLKFCALSASLLALPPGAARLMAEGLEKAKRLPVVWLSFQECTGCTESLTRSSAPSIERLLFELISLDYHHTLQAAAGLAAEQARETVLRESAGRLLLVVDGSVPTALGGAYSTIAGEDNLSLLRRCMEAAEAVLAVGTCASFGGLPAAAPIPEVMSAVLAHRVAFGSFPELDAQRRPLAFYGETVHDRCSRRGHYEAGHFAKTFDDAGARAGWCLLELGCKGPLTHNACSTVRWNGVSNPVESGHPCLGCSESGFWDRSSFYRPIEATALAASTEPGTTSTERGAAVYDSNCVYCHDTNPASLATPPDDVPTLLRSGKVRSHRFTLEDADMQALVDYPKNLS